MSLPGFESKDEQQGGFRFVREADGRILPQLYFGPRDAGGGLVKSSQAWGLHKTARTYNLKSNERSMIAMEGRIRRLASQLGLPSGVVQRAIFLYRQAQAQHVVKKPSLHDWGLALILTACREIHYIMTIEDLVARSGDSTVGRQRSKTNVRRYYNLVKSALQLRISSPGIENYITYFAGKLNITSQPTIQNALRIARLHVQENPNSTPHCVAAGALYIASEKHGFSQKSFCIQTNLSEISLRHWMARLGGYMANGLVVPDVQSADLGPEYEYEHSSTKQDRQERSPQPATPEETITDKGYPRQDNRYDDDDVSLEKIRHRGKVSLNPRRLLNRSKNVAQSRDKKSNRDDLPVHHRRTTPKASPLRARRARRKAR